MIPNSMDDIKNRELFINAIMNSSLSVEEKRDLSELIARDLKGSEKKKSKSRTKLHSPKDAIGFLYMFSQDEFFKWFTHDPEQRTIDYIQKFSEADARFQEALKNRDINQETYKTIRNFICDTGNHPKDACGVDIPFSWKDAIEWIKNNPGRDPFRECIFDGRPFKDYVASFKNAIEFRTDDEDMRFGPRLIDFIYNRCKISNEITDILEFDDSIDVIGDTLHAYLDVRMFFSAIRQIFEWIEGKRAISRKAIVKLEAFSDSYVLSIFHQGSSLVIDDQKIKGLDGDFKKVRDNLFCVADWAIEADRCYEGKLSSVRIECLDADTIGIFEGGKKYLSANTVKTLDDKVGGVKHIIRFYKNKGE